MLLRSIAKSVFAPLRLSTLALLVAGLAATAAAQRTVQPSEGTFKYALPGDRVFPEGITYQVSTGDFYVASVADGTIFKGHVGTDRIEVFSPTGADGRTVATGLRADDRRLFVAGRQTGLMYVYDTATGALLARLSNGLPEAQTWLNDVAIAPDGSAFFTDSIQPVLWRVFQRPGGEYALEEFMRFDGTPINYFDMPPARLGINLNGIMVTPDGRYLIVSKRNESRLYRIDVATKAIVAITLGIDSGRVGGVTLIFSDGLLLDGHMLYVAQNAPSQVSVVELAEDYGSGQILGTVIDPTFLRTVDVDKYEGRLLVVSSQFDRLGSPGATTGTQPPDLPFFVSDVPLPAPLAGRSSRSTR